VKKVYTTDSLVTIHHLRNLLELEGIHCIVKNEQMYTLRAEVPFTEVWPQLWVSREADMARAAEVVAEHLKGPSPDLPQWVCPRCAESLDGQFTACWHCGQDRQADDQANR